MVAFLNLRKMYLAIVCKTIICVLFAVKTTSAQEPTFDQILDVIYLKEECSEIASNPDITPAGAIECGDNNCNFPNQICVDDFIELQCVAVPPDCSTALANIDQPVTTPVIETEPPTTEDPFAFFTAPPAVSEPIPTEELTVQTESPLNQLLTGFPTEAGNPPSFVTTVPLSETESPVAGQPTVSTELPSVTELPVTETENPFAFFTTEPPVENENSVVTEPILTSERLPTGPTFFTEPYPERTAPLAITEPQPTDSPLESSVTEATVSQPSATQPTATVPQETTVDNLPVSTAIVLTKKPSDPMAETQSQRTESSVAMTEPLITGTTHEPPTATAPITDTIAQITTQQPFIWPTESNIAENTFTTAPNAQTSQFPPVQTAAPNQTVTESATDQNTYKGSVDVNADTSSAEAETEQEQALATADETVGNGQMPTANQETYNSAPEAKWGTPFGQKPSSSSYVVSGQDQHIYCCFWAHFGECLKNPTYMCVHCQKSCGTIGCTANNIYTTAVRVNTQNCPFLPNPAVAVWPHKPPQNAGAAFTNIFSQAQAYKTAKLYG